MFGKTPAQRAGEYANKVTKARRGLSSAEQMSELQKASRGNPAPRGGVTGRLEGNVAQGTGKSKLPWEKSTTPIRRGTLTTKKATVAKSKPTVDEILKDRLQKPRTPKGGSANKDYYKQGTKIKPGRGGSGGSGTNSRGGSRGSGAKGGGGGAFLPGRTGFGEQ